jgi:FAD/FMN-containing dehydrogenase
MIHPAHLSDLRAATSGAVLAAGDAGYDARRSGWDRRVVHRPAAIVVARDAGDVAAAVEHADRHQFEVVVQATGHGPVQRAGDGAILVDVSGLDGVRLDVRTSTATVGGGTRWTAVQIAANRDRSGLVAVAPAHHHVGVAGSTLVGGLGWLARAHGMSRDHVVGAEVVVPGGEVVRVTSDHHPELLWALRGGGAPAPGVVTALTVALVPRTDVYAGELRYPAEMTHEVLARYGEQLSEVPPGLTSAIVIDAGPPARVAVRACHAGPLAEGRAWLDEWRRWAEVTDDRFTVRSSSALGTLDDDPVGPSALVTTTAWLRGLGDDVIAVLAGAVLGRDAPARRVEVRHVGGAVRSGVGPGPDDPTDLLLRITAAPPRLAAAPEVEARLAELHAEVVATGATTSGAYAGFTPRPTAVLGPHVGVNS